MHDRARAAARSSTRKAALVTARQNAAAGLPVAPESGRGRGAVTCARPTLWSQTQSVASSDPARVGAVERHRRGRRRLPGRGHAARELRAAHLRLHAARPPTGTITIDGHDVAISRRRHDRRRRRPRSTATPSATVYAAATDDGTLVLSVAQTGDTGTGFIAVTDGAGALTEDAARRSRAATRCSPSTASPAVVHERDGTARSPACDSRSPA